MFMKNSSVLLFNSSFRKLSLASIPLQSIQVAEQQGYIDKEWNTALPYESVPGPSKFEFVRGVLPGGKLYGLDLISLSKRFNKDYGDILKLPTMLGRPSIVFIYDPNDFEKLLRLEGIWPFRIANETFEYYRSKVNPEPFKKYGGLISDQGERWASLRTKVNPIMMQPKTVKLYVPAIDDIAKEFVEKIRNERDDKLEMSKDFNNNMTRWALESIAYIALNTRINAMHDSDISSDGQRLVRGVRDFFQYTFELEMKPAIWKYYATPTYKKQTVALNTMTSVTQNYIEQAIARIQATDNGTEKSDHEMGVFEKLLKIDKHAAFVMATDMLMAGVDTTSTAAINLLYLLAKNPEKQQKLREEILKILPDKNSSLAMDSLSNLPYLRACLKETHRLRPVIPGTARAAGSDMVLKGYRIPKDTICVMQSMLQHVNEKMFPNTNKFIPERWLKENEPGCPSAKSAHPFAFLPFGFGPRMCVGRRFAELEIYSLTSRIVRNFNIEWHYPDMKQKSTFIILPDGDGKFRFTDV